MRRYSSLRNAILSPVLFAALIAASASMAGVNVGVDDGRPIAPSGPLVISDIDEILRLRGGEGVVVASRANREEGIEVLVRTRVALRFGTREAERFRERMKVKIRVDGRFRARGESIVMSGRWSGVVGGVLLEVRRMRIKQSGSVALRALDSLMPAARIRHPHSQRVILGRLVSNGRLALIGSFEARSVDEDHPIPLPDLRLRFRPD